MTHRKLWLIISLSFEESPLYRTDDQRELTQYGICRAYFNMTFKYLPNSTNRLFGISANRFWWSMNNRTSDRARATLCGFIAAMSKKEFEELR